MELALYRPVEEILKTETFQKPPETTPANPRHTAQEIITDSYEKLCAKSKPVSIRGWKLFQSDSQDFVFHMEDNLPNKLFATGTLLFK
jgi:hypothetical protein